MFTPKSKFTIISLLVFSKIHSLKSEHIHSFLFREYVKWISGIESRMDKTKQKGNDDERNLKFDKTNIGKTWTLLIIYGVLASWYKLIWTVLVPFILCLSCNKWRSGTYQNCWKEWNALTRQRCYRESTCCQITDTERHTVCERHMWDSINCAINAEWRTQKIW